MKQNFYIRNFITVTFPMILVAVLLSSMAIFITMESSRRTIETINEQTVARIRESTELMFSEADAQSLNYNVSPFVMLRLEDLLQNGYIDKEYLDISYMIKSFLDSNVNSKNFLHSIYIYLENSKNNFFSSSTGLSNKINSWDIDWIKKTKFIEASSRQWLEVRRIGIYAMSNNMIDVLTVYKRLYVSDHRNPIGILVMNIQQNYLESFYASYLTYPNQSIVLLKNDGTVLCKAGPFEDDSFRDLDITRGKFFVSREKNSAYGVTYLSLVPRSIVVWHARGMIQLLISAATIIVILGGIFAWMITRKNARNINNIIRLLDSAEKGEELPALSQSGDEYGYITQNIVKAFLEKNRLDRQLIEEKYILEMTRFSLLQSQLNPHFLFNTLKNIFWKTVKLTGRPNDASQMIDLLTGILRYALGSHDRYTTVDEEIENTRKYIKIQQMRFDNKFKVEWFCDSNLTGIRCIKFILQPLVENSITHGVYNKDNGINTIEICKDTNSLHFAILDNGHGIAPTQLQKIRRCLADENTPVEHIGLYNLNTRLLLAYGSGSELAIQSIPETGTCIRFSIPLLLG